MPLASEEPKASEASKVLEVLQVCAVQVLEAPLTLRTPQPEVPKVFPVEEVSTSSILSLVPELLEASEVSEVPEVFEVYAVRVHTVILKIIAMPNLDVVCKAHYKYPLKYNLSSVMNSKDYPKSSLELLKHFYSWNHFYSAMYINFLNSL